MIEVETMIDDYELFVNDLKIRFGDKFYDVIHHIEFIDDEVPFVKFITYLNEQELFDLAIYCGQQEFKRIYLNYSPNT